MTEDQTIYKEIGRLLWSIMPQEAREMQFIAAIYPSDTGYGAQWTNKDDSDGRFGFERPKAVERELLALCKRLQTLPPFAHEPFTHCEARLSEAGKFHMEFAYIPRENSWVSIFMRGISDLSWEEAEIKGITRDEWETCVAKFGPTKRA